MHRIHLAELSFRNSLVQQFAHPPVDGLKIRLDQPVDVHRITLARPHHLALHQLGINLVGGDEIEICAYVSHDFLAWRQIAVERMEDPGLHPRKRMVEDRAVEGLFVLEVVIKEGLVDARLARNGIRAGAGNAVLGKLLRRRLQNGGAAFLRLPARTHAGMMAMAKELSYDLINQLVRLSIDGQKRNFKCRIWKIGRSGYRAPPAIEGTSSTSSPSLNA